VDSKAEYSALSGTHSQKKETKTNKRQCPFNTALTAVEGGTCCEAVAWRGRVVVGR